MAKKYTTQDLIYDLAYIAVLLGIFILLIGFAPELYEKSLKLLKFS